MRNLSVGCKLVAIVLLAAAVQSCKKRRNDIDNNQIISKPYSLFIVDTIGRIENTNDGKQFHIAFGATGSNTRAIGTSAENLIWVGKTDAFVATNKELIVGNNLNLNPINLPASTNAAWQSMILDVPSYNRVFLAGNAGNGVIYSDTNGKIGTWKIDNNFNPSITGSVVITSYTQLANGLVLAFDHINTRIFQKTGKNDAWTENQMITALPKTGKFFISHILNTVVAGDSTGTNGVWYSNDNGVNWAQYTGLPTGAQVMCMLAPFDRALLVGTSAYGVYRLPLNGTAFEPSSDGLNATINVRGIAAKNDLYKNDQVAEYVYLATDFGLYRSMDIGRNWILMRRGNYIACY